MLPVAEVRDGRNHGRNGIAQEHVGKSVAGVLLIARIDGRELTAERDAPTGLAYLKQIELVKAELRSHLEPMLAVDKAECVIELDVLSGTPCRCVARFTEPPVATGLHQGQAVNQWVVGNTGKLQALWRIILSVGRDIRNVMDTVEPNARRIHEIRGNRMRVAEHEPARAQRPIARVVTSAVRKAGECGGLEAMILTQGEPLEELDLR